MKSTQRGEGDILVVPRENCEASKLSDLPALALVFMKCNKNTSLTHSHVDGKHFPFFGGLFS